jgi:hypothetical protein
MLYTRFVIGELTLSRTRDFIRRHSAALSTTVNSFILCLLLGNIGSPTTLPLDGVDSKQMNDVARRRQKGNAEVLAASAFRLTGGSR